MKRTQLAIMAITVFILMALVTGCTTRIHGVKVVYPTGDEKFWNDPELKNRFEEYWSLVFAGDAEKSFLLEAPYFQEMVHFKKYKAYIRAKAGNRPKEFVVREFGNVAEKLYKVDYVVRLKKSNDTIKDVHISDFWVIAEGKWFHVIRDRIIFPVI